MERKRKNKLAAVRTALGQSPRHKPSVDAVEPEVRTDNSLPFTQPDAQFVRSSNADAALIVEWGFDVAEAKWAEFHKWLAANEADLAKAAPGPGVIYKGTVVAVFGPLHRPDGRYRTFWALNSIQDVQNFWTNSKSKDFQRLVKELVAFRDRTSKSGFSQLYRVAAGAPVY
jgi:hypothetical protein